MNCKEEEMWDSEQEAAIPEDYEYVPRGDHFITRTIKRLCGDDDSTVFVRMTKNGRYRRAKGYFAPGEIVAEAKRLKTETEEKRQVQREKAAAHREKQERRYAEEFRNRISKIYPSLPAEDAAVVADRACEVGSDRVGRTKQLELDEKVRLAVAAHARHNYTSYEEQLSDVHFEDDYLEVRREIAPEVSALLDEWSKASVKSA